MFYSTLKLYKDLYELIHKPEHNIRLTSENNKKLTFKKFDLYSIFKSIFDNIIIINKNQNNKIELIPFNEDKLRTKVYNYLYYEINKGIDDINLDSMRNKDKRNIYNFTLNMNDIFEKHIYILNNEIEKLNEIKAKVTREINILKNMESSAKTQVTNKQSYISDLETEKNKLNTQIQSLESSVNQKKQSINTGLGASAIQNAFGLITIDKVNSIDNKILVEKFMKHVKHTTFDEHFNKYNEAINKYNYTPIVGKTKVEIMGFKSPDIVSELSNLVKYEKINSSSTQPQQSDINSEIEKFKTKVLPTFLDSIDLTDSGIGVSVPTPTFKKEDMDKFKTFLLDYCKNTNEPFYEAECNYIATNDPKFKTGRDSFNTIQTTLNTYNEELSRLTDYQKKLSDIISEIREIREGPEEYTKQLNAKNTYNNRIDQQLDELKGILEKKQTSNKELQDLIGSESFKTLLNELYGSLIMRYKSVYTLIKKQIIQSEVYNMFSEDSLYKTIKALHDLLSQLYNDEGKIVDPLQKEAIVEIVKSFQTYVNKRLEDFPKVVEKSEGEVRFKKYHIRSMANVLKGQKYGNYEISKNTNMKKFVKKVKDQNVDDLLSLLKTLYNKEITIDQVDKDKLKYYVQTYGNKISKGTSVTTQQPIIPNQSKPTTPLQQPIIPNQSKPTTPLQQSVIPNESKSGTPLQQPNVSNQSKSATPLQQSVIPNQSKSGTPLQQPVISNQSKSATPLQQSVIPNQSKSATQQQSSIKNIPQIGGSSNKENKIVPVNRNNKEKSFMNRIYNILLEDNSKSSKDFVNRLKQYEYKILNQAKAKIRTFTYLYDRGNKTGTNKIKDHILYIYHMTRVCLDDFDKELTEIFKRGKSSNERINILLISKYIYMEVIMIYALSYFC